MDSHENRPLTEVVPQDTTEVTAITEVIAVMSSGNKITVPSDSLAYT